MTDAELVDYYVDLLILQYRNKARAPEHIRTLLDTVVILELITAVENGFNIDTAVGAQLDILGKYLGLTRFEVASDDATYREYLKYKIVQNNTNSSLYNIDEGLYDLFGTNVLLYDNSDMSMTYTFYDQSISDVRAIFNAGILPKPAGVNITVVSSTSRPFAFAGTTRGAGFGSVGGTPQGGEFSSVVNK